MAERVVVVRHGATDWSAARRHTGRTDVPLNAQGRARATRLAPVLASLSGIDGALVLTSPLARAAETCRLAGCGDRAEPCADLVEWDYGVAEGRTTADLRVDVPGWSVWTHAIEGAESVDSVGRRADAVIARLGDHGGVAVLFAHAHILRILAARWLELPAAEGRRFTLEPASLSVLGHERETRVVEHWNVVGARQGQLWSASARATDAGAGGPAATLPAMSADGSPTR